jgi:hypothetical protein
LTGYTRLGWLGPPSANSSLVRLDTLGALTLPKEPNMPKTSESMLYVKIPTSTHRKARVRAIIDAVTLSQLVEAALEKYLTSKGTTETTPTTEAP